MSYYSTSQQKLLQSETQIYNTPILLAGVLQLLDGLLDQDSKPNTVYKVGPDCVVDLLDLNTRERACFELVMPNDVFNKAGNLSVFSLLGSQLLGLEKGDRCKLVLSDQEHQFEVIDVRKIK